jgi:TM2 domain-containing membrane protein YozV
MNCAQHSETPAAAYCRTCGKALCEVCKRDVRGAIYCEDCLASRVQAPPAQPGLLPPGSGPHPPVAGMLAFFLPFGVAQAYNGQYARGLVYLVAFIGLLWGLTQGTGAEPVLGVLMGALYFWQLIDAARSAHYLQRGLPAPDPFGIDRLFGGAAPQTVSAVPPTTSAPPVPPVPSAPPSAFVPPENPPYGPPYGGAGGSFDPGLYRGRHDRMHRHSNAPLGAVILIGIGVMLLLGNIGLLRFRWAGEFWPVILIIIGGWKLAERWELIAMGGSRGRHLVLGPAILLALGFAFLAQSVGWIGFGLTWPAILIVIGVVLLWQRSSQAPGPLPPPAPTATTPVPPTAPESGPDRGEDKAGQP